MYKLNDRRELSKNIAKYLQELVYGEVRVDEDIILQTFKLYIFNKGDFTFSYDISEILYKIKTEHDADMYVDYILTDYKRTILSRYIV